MHDLLDDLRTTAAPSRTNWPEEGAETLPATPETVVRLARSAEQSVAGKAHEYPADHRSQQDPGLECRDRVGARRAPMAMAFGWSPWR
jgi:hypothetical protein